MIEQGREIQEDPKFWLDFINIPSELIADDDLTPKEMMLFGLIQAMDNPINGCFASNGYLGTVLNLGMSTISSGISKLKEKEWILDNGMSNQRRILRINPKYKIIGRENVKKLSQKIIDFKEKSDSCIPENQKAAFRKIRKLPSEKSEYKNKVYDNINNGRLKSNNRTSSFSDKTTDEVKPIPIEKDFIPIPRKNKYLSHWNFLNISNHKPDYKGQGNQTYIRAVSILKDIEKGQFLNMREIDPEFMAKHKMTHQQLSTPLSENKIIETITKLKYLFMEGYWGYKKFNRMKNLSLLLWNPSSKTSMFFAVLVNKSLTIPISEKQEIKDDNKEFTDLFLSLFQNGNGNRISRREHLQLVYGVKDIIQKHKEYCSIVREQKDLVDPRALFFPNFRNLDDFVKYYRDYIRVMGENKNIHPGLVSPKSWMWKEFVNELYDDLDIDLREQIKND